ncbi:hypothetical protein Hypma_001607 [Hypsizygus marmoreus]|uniref:DUF6697 domain-containing protein n=1 Tax=Hypsizygus marmoreus TaxID=39966 RepID=A0A369J8G4_HYPMA|nr:hypothetical protein Hypma_001607 [Hypsizygus marmoreus]
MEPRNLLAENARIQSQLDDTESELDDVRKERDLFREELSRNRAHVARLTSLAEAQESKVRDLERQLERIQRVQRKHEIPAQYATVEEKECGTSIRENDIKQGVVPVTVEVEILETLFAAEGDASALAPAEAPLLSTDSPSLCHSSTSPIAKSDGIARKEVSRITDLPAKRPSEPSVDSDQRQSKRRKAEVPDHLEKSTINPQKNTPNPTCVISPSRALLPHGNIGVSAIPRVHSNTYPQASHSTVLHVLSSPTPTLENHVVHNFFTPTLSLQSGDPSSDHHTERALPITPPQTPQEQTYTGASNIPFSRTNDPDGRLRPLDMMPAQVPLMPTVHGALHGSEMTPGIAPPSSNQLISLSGPNDLPLPPIINRLGHQRQRRDRQSRTSSTTSVPFLATMAQPMTQRHPLELAPPVPEGEDNVCRFLRMTRSFIVSDPVILPLYPSRAMLSEWYGGEKQDVTFSQVKGGRNHIFLSAESSPARPKALGDPAVVLLTNTIKGGFESAVFIRVGSDESWEYSGQYRCRVRPMQPGEFQRLPDQFKIRFARDMLKRRGRTAGLPANILRRQLGALYSTSQHGAAPGRFLQVGDIIQALENGDEVLWLGFLQCIGYDHSFAKELEGFMRQRPQVGGRTRAAGASSTGRVWGK